MIVHRTQPTRSSCGQTVCAMLVGMEPADVGREMGKLTGTHGIDLIRWLRTRGFRCPDRPQRFVGYSPNIDPRPRLPPIAIVRIDFGTNRRRTHWILWAEGRFWDPDAPDSDAVSSTMSMGHGRIYSIIPITRPSP